MEVGTSSQPPSYEEACAGSNTANHLSRRDHLTQSNHSNGSTPVKPIITPNDSPMKKDEATPSPSKDKVGSLLALLLEKEKETAKSSPPPYNHRKSTSMEDNKADSPGYRHSVNFTGATLAIPPAGYAKRNSLDGTLKLQVSPRHDKPIVAMYLNSLNRSQTDLNNPKQDTTLPEIKVTYEDDPLMQQFSEIQQLFDRVEKSSKRLAEDYGRLTEGPSSKEKWMEDYQLLRSENTRLVHQVTQLNLQNQKSQQTIETLTKSKALEQNAKNEQLLSIINSMKDFISSQNIQLPDNVKQQLEALESQPAANITHKRPPAFAPTITSGPVGPTNNILRSSAPGGTSTLRNSSSAANKVRICKTSGKTMNQLVFGPVNFSDSQPSALTRYKWTCCGITTKDHP